MHGCESDVTNDRHNIEKLVKIFDLTFSETYIGWD